jgi:hypothetical protein
MKLVKIDNYEVRFEDELLLLKPFRVLYNADKTKDKSHFLDFLSIVYFQFDPRSDFMYIADEEERLKAICEANGYSIPKFNKQEIVCINLYKQMVTSASSLLLEDTRITISKIREMLRDIDFSELEEKDKVNAIKTVASTVSMIPKLVKDLTEAEKAVTKEIEESGRARGGNTKKLFEDGL